jgi:cell wall-associated NlpC family hydrolase
VQYGFTASGAPAPTDPSLAEPVSTSGCEAGIFSLEAPSSSQIVKVAESQLGKREHPQGSDCTIYGPCEEWCSLFASWVWKKAGVPLPGSTAAYGSSGSLYTWAKENGGKILPATATPAPGDLVFYGTGPEPGESDHVGVVRHVFPDGQISTIEGNYNGRVSPVGPFPPSSPTGEQAPIYGYAQPPAPRVKGQGA